MINELVNNKSQLKLKLNVVLLELNVPGIAPVIIPKFCIEANGSRSLGDFLVTFSVKYLVKD